MESEWALNVVREGLAGIRLGQWSPPRRPFLLARLDEQRVIINDYRWIGGTTIFNWFWYPFDGRTPITFGPNQSIAGLHRFPFGLPTVPSPPW